jgi:uncharacterized protein (DUF2141 family)
MKTLPIFLLLLNSFFIFGQKAETQTADLQIRFDNVTIQKGIIYIGLYKTEADFNNKQAFKRAKINLASLKPGQPVMCSFTDLPKGTYAVLSVQDLNFNEKLDFNQDFMPEEPWGLSNNKMVYGPPSWSDAKFDLNDNQTITIELF